MKKLHDIADVVARVAFVAVVFYAMVTTLRIVLG